VFDIHERAQVMTIAFYNGGVRVVDLSGLTGVSIGGDQLTGAGMKEIASYKVDGGESWSAKTPFINSATGDFYLYSNDIERGLDIFRFDAQAPTSASAGTWMSAAEYERYAASKPRVDGDYQLACLL
jgi:hypothetical protein